MAVAVALVNGATIIGVGAPGVKPWRLTRTERAWRDGPNDHTDIARHVAKHALAETRRHATGGENGLGHQQAAIAVLAGRLARSLSTDSGVPDRDG